MADVKTAPPERAKVIMAGTFPPPLHGMAAVNDAVRQRLVEAGADLSTMDTAAPSLHRGLLPRLGRLPRVLGGLFGLLRMRGLREQTFYISVSGGLGQAYDLLFVLLARIRGMRVFLHHHCYAYLDKPTLMTALLMRIAGTNALHIALSSGMGERLRTCYRGVGSVASISNAALLTCGSTEPAPARMRLRVIGFLSNISVEKGIHEFLDVCAAVHERGLPITARLAGPFQDAAVESAVRQRLANLPNVEYLGPQYGDAKADFYKGIDVLLFPTRYANEAEPLTIHEALSAGVPVIAYGRGAIPEILTPACGKVIPTVADFTSPAMDQIVGWFDGPQLLQAASVAACARFAALRAENTSHWEAVEAQMLDSNPIAAIARA